jgi:hypothetical protein
MRFMMLCAIGTVSAAWFFSVEAQQPTSLADRAAAFQQAEAQKVIDAALVELKSEDPKRRLDVLRGLHYAKPAVARGVIGEVFGCMQSDPDPTVRIAAYQTLTKMHERAAPIIAEDIKTILER